MSIGKSQEALHGGVLSSRSGTLVQGGPLAPLAVPSGARTSALHPACPSPPPVIPNAPVEPSGLSSYSDFLLLGPEPDNSKQNSEV